MTNELDIDLDEEIYDLPKYKIRVERRDERKIMQGKLDKLDIIES
jgi:hypothetical protein